ncbi:LysR family transcriptional regulator [Silvimonas sp. JCM 19000]
MDRLQAMRIFTRVAELGSFSRAAEQLQLPRPSVSNAVQELETRLRVRLFQRTTRKVSLTREGTAYLAQCQAVLREFDASEAMFQSAHTGPRGTIKVDLPERMALLTVIPALPDFLQQYPDLRVIVGASDRFADLFEAGIDCVVRVGQLHDSTLVARRLGEYPQGNYAAPSYIDTYGAPRTLDELPAHFAVGYQTRNGRDADWEYLRDGQVHTLAVPTRVAVSSAQAYLACCQAGLGMIQVPRAGLLKEIQRGELVEVLPDFPPPALPVSVLYPHGRHLAPRVRVFIDWVSALLAPQIQPPERPAPSAE